MNNPFKLLLLALIVASCNTATTKKDTMEDQSNKTEQLMIAINDTIPKVTGIGGIFFGSENPKETREWYGKNLGLAIDDFGSPFEFRNTNRPDEINYLRWSPFEKGTDYFVPSEKEFMIVYRIQNIEGLVKKLEPISKIKSNFGNLLTVF